MKVNTEDTINQEANLYLDNPELAPSTDSKRDVTSVTFLMMCVGFYVQLVSFISGAQMFPTLSPLTILICVTVGNLVVWLFFGFDWGHWTSTWNSIFRIYEGTIRISWRLLSRYCASNTSYLLVWLPDLDGECSYQCNFKIFIWF